ncbi:4Fe-4S binding protein [Streptomyces sp. NPDC058001]|uniref:4Fe-4S binding protein n=1 Tax=Streptomyces sp. NPDC058001 TaxID=3346300 RepID=UPI0036E3A1B0
MSPAPHEDEFDAAEQMYINPDACINCGACRDVCPVLAIYAEGGLPPQWAHYAEVNREYFTVRG